jgi:Icc-related predicted phosphoesterase
VGALRVGEVTIYYAADIHGSDRCWRKFLNAAGFYGASVLILGGDVTGKVLVPIVRRREGWIGRILGEPKVAGTREELAQLERIVQANGLYPYVCDQDEYERLEEDESYRRKVFSEVMRDGLGRWIEFADERLRGAGIECYVMPGNDDELGIEDLIEGSTTVVNPENRVVEIGGGEFEMISCGWANPTPWNSPRECSEEELGRKIEEMLPGLTGTKPALYNLHVPPHASGLDWAPRLTPDLRPIQRGGELQMEPVGSKSVDAALRDGQPLLALHGHIHESRGSARIGRTVSLNPGSRYGMGALDGALVTVSRGKVKSYQLVSG